MIIKPFFPVDSLPDKQQNISRRKVFENSEKLKTYLPSQSDDKEKRFLTYQQEAKDRTVERLKLFKYCLLNLDTGLGKTYITLQLLAEEKIISMKKDTPVLIVCPAQNINDPWRSEISAFKENFFSGKTPNVYLYHGKNRDSLSFNNTLCVNGYHFVITSYQTLLSPSCNPYFFKNHFKLIIFDEPQTVIGSPKISKAFEKIIELQADYRLALTASPIGNSIKEMFIMLKLLEKKDNISDIKRSLKNLSDNEIQKYITNKSISYSKNDNDIAEEMELPELHEYKIILPIGDDACSESETNKSIPKKNKALTKIDDKLDLNTSKYNCLLHILRKIPEDEKIIIFSMYPSTLSKVYSYIYKQYTCFKIIGGMSINKKKEIQDEFKRYSGKAIILASLKANTTGLNYQTANNIIFMESWYNPQVIKQARDRCYRMGQNKDVFVYHLSTYTDFEKSVWKIKDKKNSAANTVLHLDSDHNLQIVDLSSDINGENYLELIDNMLLNNYPPKEIEKPVSYKYKNGD